MTETGWYVYGIVDADRADDDPVRLVRTDRLAAAVAPVDLAEFSDLDERLNDRAWVEQKALEHVGELRRRGTSVTPVCQIGHEPSSASLRW